MGWHLLETLLQQVGEHSTLVGKLWVTATFVFRFIVVASVGDAVYSDEQSDFTCNTGQPGCENVCFNLFSPIGHLRFWAAQILAVCTPSIVFIVYAAHMLLKVSQDDSENFDEEDDFPPLEEELLPPEPHAAGSPKKRKVGRVPSTGSRQSRHAGPKERISTVRGFSNRPKEVAMTIDDIREEEEKEECEDLVDGDEIMPDEGESTISEINRELVSYDKNKKENRIKRSVQVFYVVALFLRTGFECIFIWLQYELYGFTVPELFQCERFPCPNIVDCFVSRPREKTIFLWFMFAVSSLCLALNVIEIKYLGLKRLKLICGNADTALGDDNKFDEEDDKCLTVDDGSTNSKCSYFRVGEKINPSAPPDTDVNHLYNVVDYKTEDDDAIGFDAIGNQPRHPAPGYPYIHRYRMVLNAAPHFGEPEKSYL